MLVHSPLDCAEQSGRFCAGTTTRDQPDTSARKIKGIAQVRRGRVAGAEWGQAETHLDRLQNRSRIVGGVIDEAALSERGHNEHRYAKPRPPAVALRRFNMVPCAAILVSRDDDCRIGPVRARLDQPDDLSYVC